MKTIMHPNKVARGNDLDRRSSKVSRSLPKNQMLQNTRSRGQHTSHLPGRVSNIESHRQEAHRPHHNTQTEKQGSKHASGAAHRSYSKAYNSTMDGTAPTYRKNRPRQQTVAKIRPLLAVGECFSACCILLPSFNVLLAYTRIRHSKVTLFFSLQAFRTDVPNATGSKRMPRPLAASFVQPESTLKRMTRFLLTLPMCFPHLACFIGIFSL